MSGKLQQALDRDVLHFTELRAERSISELYTAIRGSNSSLSRRPRKQLEQSIARALELTIEENNKREMEDKNEQREMEEKNEQREMGEKNLMNGSLVKAKRKTNGDIPYPKRKVLGSSTAHLPPTHVTLEDMGGIGPVLKQFKELVVLPLRRPFLYLDNLSRPTRGILLHGPPGCGKTMIANAFAAEVGVPFITFSAPSIVSGMSGESEKALRDHFEEAKRCAPCLMFIDEFDAICPKRENAQREMERRIVAQLLTCMDDLQLEKTRNKAVIVIAATNRPDSLDPAIRRAGRFDKEINLGVPSQAVREQILRTLTRRMSIPADFDFPRLAKMTPGYVGADLSDLVSTAGGSAIQRYMESLEAAGDESEMETDDNRVPVDEELRKLRKLLKQTEGPQGDEASHKVEITNEDLFNALSKVQPSAKREGFTTVPNTTWADVGALRASREALETAIVRPISEPERYAEMGMAYGGVLLWGPPGCGKTLLAKAVANESQANFISVKGPELLNKYVGESERAIRQVFLRARSSVPCVIFFDELDALVPARKDALSESATRVINTLLTELDGLDGRTGIYVIGATNRPDMIDPAILRNGRLDVHLFIDVPFKEERIDILRTLARKYPLEAVDNDLAELARGCHNYSGADLTGLLRQAGRIAIRRQSRTISLDDLRRAKVEIQSSVMNYDDYQRFNEQWGQRATLGSNI